MNVQQRFLNRSHLAGLLCGLALAVAQLFSPAGVGTAQAATTTCTPNGAMYDCTVTFTYTGAPENWTVPAGVTQVTFALSGAPGGGQGGAPGGRVVATLAVRPGTTYQIRVGGHGWYGGYNGGGKGAGGRNGGGASDVRSGAYGLEDRLLVAGGGGGGGDFNATSRSGGRVYYRPQSGDCGGGRAGGEGATAGSLGQGGDGDLRSELTAGGGGGYCGGGGGAHPNPGGDAGLDYSNGEVTADSGGGGGGSNYVYPATGLPADFPIEYLSNAPNLGILPDGIIYYFGDVLFDSFAVTPGVTIRFQSKGSVGAWGTNTAGETSVPAGLQASVLVGGRWHSLALKQDGTVVAWGCSGGYNYGQCTIPAGLSGVKAISAAPYHSLAVKSDGTVVAWGCGTGNYGQCAVPAGLSGVKAVAAAIFHSVALKNDGTVVIWGCGAPGTSTPCTMPRGLNGVKAIAAGLNHTLALKNDGTVVGWGINSAGETNGATAGSGVIAIAAAGSHSLALKSNGTVVAWGDNTAGQNNIPAGLSGVVAIAAGAYHSLALKQDGTVVAWGCGVYNDGQCTVPTGLSRVVAIGAGHRHSLALAAVVPGGGMAASAAVSADTVVQPATPTLEGFSFITESEPVNAPDAAVTADVTVAQNQRLFLPLVANNGTMAASDGAAVAPVIEAEASGAAVDATVATTLTQPVTTTAPAAVITISAPASAPVAVDAAAIVTVSAPVSAPVAVEAAPVITESAPAVEAAPVVTASVSVSVPVAVEAVPVITENAPAVVEAAPVVTASVPVSVPTVVEAAPVVTESVPAAVEALPAVTDTLVLTATQPITPDAATANPLAGTAVGSRGGIVVLLLVGLAVAGSLVWQRRQSRTGR